jgi:hypothetical protein
LAESALSEPQEIKCAKCNIPLKGPADPQPQDRIACPRCGVGDTFENISAEITEYIGEQLVKALARQTEAAFSKSKNMKLAQTPRPQKSYRFIVDFEPPHQRHSNSAFFLSISTSGRSSRLISEFLAF